MSSLTTLQQTLPPYLDQNNPSVNALVQAIASVLDNQDQAITDLRTLASVVGATGNDVDYLASFFGLYRMVNETDGHLLSRMAATPLPRATQFYFPQAVQAITGQAADLWIPGGGQLRDWDLLTNFNWTRTSVAQTFSRSGSAYNPFTNTTVGANVPTFWPMGVFPSEDVQTGVGVSPASTNLMPYSNLSSTASTTVWQADTALLGTWEAPIGNLTDLADGITVTLSSTEDVLITGSSLWTGTLTGRLKYSGTPSLVGIVLDASSNGNCYYAAFTGTDVVGGILLNSTFTQLGATTYSLAAGTFAWLRIEQSGTTLTVYYAPDASGSPGTWTQAFSVTDSTFTSGKVGLLLQGSSGETLTCTNLTLQAEFPTTATPGPNGAFYDFLALNSNPQFVLTGNTIRWASAGGNLPTSLSFSPVTVSPNTTYALSAWVLAANLTGTATLEVYDASAQTTATLATITHQAGWVRLGGTYTTGTTASTLQLQMSFPATAGGTLDIGFLQIETPVQTPYISNTTSGTASRQAESLNVQASLPINGQGTVVIEAMIGSPGTILEWASGQASLAWNGTEFTFTLGNGTHSASVTNTPATPAGTYLLVGEWGDYGMRLWVNGTVQNSTTLYTPQTADSTLYIGSGASSPGPGGYYANIVVASASYPQAEVAKWTPGIATPVFIPDLFHAYYVNGDFTAFRPGLFEFMGVWGFEASGLASYSGTLVLDQGYLDVNYLLGAQTPAIDIFGGGLPAQIVQQSVPAGQMVLPWIRGQIT
jgi:hypothetical protein